MSEITVLYATRTGHSKKLAEVIGKALNVKAQNIKDNPDFKKDGLLFVVSGIYGGVSMPQLLDYVKAMDKGRITQVAIITSCASGKKKQTELRQLLEEKGIEVIDEFICRGAFLFVSMRHPDKGDLQAATDFAKEIVKSIQ